MVGSEIRYSTLGFHLLAKPAGAMCNLACKYCFFLSKEKLYPNSTFRMSDELLDLYIRRLIESQPPSQVNIVWQGGEPTLMGIDFFRRAIELQQKYKKPGMVIQNSMQTNGVLIDDEWGLFFSENDFLVGISIDGPQKLHNQFRVDKRGKPTHEKVMKGLGYLKKYNVQFNVLATVNAANEKYPAKVYRFLKNQACAQFVQFIPIVEYKKLNGRILVSDGSVQPRQYGKFMSDIFDEWAQHDVGKIYVQMFDAALANRIGAPPGVCIFAPVCGVSPVLEHNGDVYACDHFVDPEYLLGNINNSPLQVLMNKNIMHTFGNAKLNTLPQYCQKCDVLFACHGGCPKDRFLKAPDGEPGLNYLCPGYKKFFNHIKQPMGIMAQQLKNNLAQ